jgi:ribosome-binding factor A
MRLRPQKVADMIQRELSDLLRRDLRDPSVGMVTITAVDVSPDFSNAQVLFTCLDAAHVEEAKRGLRRRPGSCARSSRAGSSSTRRRSCASSTTSPSSAATGCTGLIDSVRAKS